MGEGKKHGKLRKFFLFAMIASLGGAILAFFKRRRGAGLDENEWQELPPPDRS
jgi:hypothetical protein